MKWAYYGYGGDRDAKQNGDFMQRAFVHVS